jgi:hypothetical protein
MNLSVMLESRFIGAKHLERDGINLIPLTPFSDFREGGMSIVPLSACGEGNLKGVR